MKLQFADLKKRWQIRSALAITLESARIVVTHMRDTEGRAAVGETFTLPFPSEEIVKNARTIGTELAAQLNATGIRERRCVICIPPGWALTTTTDAPDLTGEDLTGFLELHAEREFPAAAADLRLAHSLFTLPDGRRRVTVAAVPGKRLEALERMLEAAGCRAVSISLGLDQFLDEAPTPAAVHFLANCDHVDLVVTSGGGVAALRSLAVPPIAADTIFDAAAFTRDVRITLGRLPEALRDQLRQAHFSGTQPAAAIICRGTREHLRRMGIEPGECPPEGAEAPPSAQAAAARFLQRRPVTFEFVVTQINRWQAGMQRFENPRFRWMVGAGAAVIIIPLLVFSIRSNMESSLESEWNGMRRTVADLDDLQAQIRQFRPWFDTTPHALQLLESLVTAFPEQGDVWAKGIEITEGSKVTCTGFARNQAALIVLLDRLRMRKDITELRAPQVRGENPVQFSLTFKWDPKHE